MYEPVGLFSLSAMGGRYHAPHHPLHQTDLDIPSTWLVAPYFMLYFIMYVVNVLVWPLQLMERSCIALLPADQSVLYTFDQHGFNKITNSCVSFYVTGLNNTQSEIAINAVNQTSNIMILAAFGGGVISLLSYFLIWKPLLNRCRSLAVFFPPVCLVAQSIILIQAQNIRDFETYKYTVLASVLVPSLHANFQGVFLQLYHMTEVPEVKTNRALMHTRLDGSHTVIFIAIAIGGAFVTGCFDISYNLVFFLQFTLGSVNIMYAITLMPSNSCMEGVEEDDEDDEEEEVKINQGKEDAKTEKRKISLRSSDSSVEEFFLGDLAKKKKDGGLLTTNKVNILKEAPMIFTETSYRMELIVVIEICVFTAALLSDTTFAGLYFVQHDFNFDLRIFGGLVLAQGIVKICGMLFMKFIIRFTQVKHGSLIGIALLNYIVYYIALSLASSTTVIMVVMFTNIFGGLALPTIFSYMKINFKETTETVLELSVLSSILVAMAFNALTSFLYDKTHALFPGTIFALTAALLAICGIIIVATYYSTSKKNKRMSKYFADRLLNNSN